MCAASVELANILGLEFPADDGVEWAHEVGLPRVNEKARRFDLDVLAFHVEGLAGRTNAFMRPLAAGTEVGGRANDVKVSLHAPPLRALVHVSDCFEHSSRRSGDEYLRQDRVLIGSELCSCHVLNPPYR